MRVRDILQGLPDYRAGRPSPPVAGLRAHKLSSNENPYPPLPSVVRAITEAAQQVNRYPDASNAALLARLASHLGVAEQELVLGTGSVDVLAKILAIMCDPGDEVVFAWRSFEAYPIVTQLAAATGVPVPVTADGRHDLDAMAAAVSERTRIVLLCTPNNPTGPALTRTEVDDFLQRCPRDVLVVLDEAYVEFVRAGDALDGIRTVREHPNVLVLRTFSKAYGLAGLRVGYAVCHPELARALRSASTPFGVNLVAQAAALASLEATSEMLERVAAIVAERERVVQGLRDQGWAIPDTDANFVWFPVGGSSVELANACAERALAVRAFDGDGVRVSIGAPEANSRLLDLTATLTHLRPKG